MAKLPLRRRKSVQQAAISLALSAAHHSGRPSGAEKAVALAVKKFGRLELVANNAGRILYKPVIEMTRQDWQWQIETNVTGALLHSRQAVKAMMPNKSGAIVKVVEQKHTGLSNRVQQVVILSIGSIWKARYELYAHSEAAQKAGLLDHAIRALAAQSATDLSDEGGLLGSSRCSWLAEHRIGAELYEAAVTCFNEKGLVDMIMLAGCYHLVCSLLNAFTVPAPELIQELSSGGVTMTQKVRARMTVAAEFPDHFFLENIAVRSDNSMLITVLNRKALYYLPPPEADSQMRPLLLHTFDALAGGIAELEPDVFSVLTGNIYTTHDNYLHRLDLRGWTPGESITPEQVLAFPRSMLGINGCCAVSPATMFATDTFGGAIWRVDFARDGRTEAKRWLKHESMAHVQDTLPPPRQPGINGLRYAGRTNHLYYTTTGQKLFMRVAVDPASRDPAGEPEQVSGGGMYDDFCIDDVRGLAYLTVHRENRIDCVSLEPGGPPPRALAGERLDAILLGPSSAAWSRAPAEAGRVIFVTTDGGDTAPPPDGSVQTAKVLRMELLG